MTKKYFYFFLFIVSTLPHSAIAQQNTPYFDMSFDELLNTEVYGPAALTKLSRLKTPASATTISEEDIKYSAARNIYDLIETYVPGAFWMNNENGPNLGMRGILVDYNYKYLLLVNNRAVNSKAHSGAKSELEQWDLSDIQRIEVVRGPGSVTYGPGAVAGVINIITHDSQSKSKKKISKKRFLLMVEVPGIDLLTGLYSFYLPYFFVEK